MEVPVQHTKTHIKKIRKKQIGLYVSSEANDDDVCQAVKILSSSAAVECCSLPGYLMRPQRRHRQCLHKPSRYHHIGGTNAHLFYNNRYVSTGTSKRLQRIRWNGDLGTKNRVLQQHQELFCCFLPALQESTSLKELYINFPLFGGPSNLALENLLTHTQSLRSLSLSCPTDQENIAVDAAGSGLKKNTTLRELTLEFSRGAKTQTVSPILTSLRAHPLLRRLCLQGHVVDLTGLKTVLLSDTSKITELDTHRFFRGLHIMDSTAHDSHLPILGLTRVLRAFARHPALTKLGLRRCPLGSDEARLLRVALCNMPNLQSLDLASNDLGSAGLAELAPALYCDMSIKVLDLSENDLNHMESAGLLRDILRRNKTLTTLDLSRNTFGITTGAVECIADGLGSNSTLLKIDFSNCCLGDRDVSILTQTFFLGTRRYRNLHLV
jgi:hypothetical protein